MIALQEGSSAMAEYQLYCFAQSGNAYRAALMLNLIGANWQPVFVDFFKAGVQRTAEYRSDVNEMGEVPVLIHGTKKLSQSGVILLYLAERSGKFTIGLWIGDRYGYPLTTVPTSD
jgi:glutathione S-transferase